MLDNKFIRFGSAGTLLLAGIGLGWMGHDVVVEGMDQRLQTIESGIDGLEQGQQSLSEQFEEIQKARNQPQTIKVEAETGYYGNPVLDAPENNLTIDGITFSFEKDLKQDGNLLYGQAHLESNQVDLNTRQEPVQFYETCTHEVIGHIRSGYRHSDPVKDYSNGDDWIERHQSYLKSPTCLKLLYRLNGGQNIE